MNVKSLATNRSSSEKHKWNAHDSTMPPPFAETNLPKRGSSWAGMVTKRSLRAEPAAGVPRKAVHIVIIATVLGGITIFAIGLVVIYRLYMKKFDREERRRQSQVRKNGTRKEPTMPEPRKAPQKISSHSIDGNIPSAGPKKPREN